MDRPRDSHLVTTSAFAEGSEAGRCTEAYSASVFVLSLQQVPPASILARCHRSTVPDRQPRVVITLFAWSSHAETGYAPVNCCEEDETSSIFPSAWSRLFDPWRERIATRPGRAGGRRRARSRRPTERSLTLRSSKCTSPMSPACGAGGRWDVRLGRGWLHTTTGVR